MMYSKVARKNWKAFIRNSMILFAKLPKLIYLESTSVCVVGSGPAGYYATAALLKNPNFEFDVTVLDKQFTPFGLVRTGVAPDHPEVPPNSNSLADVLFNNIII